MAPEKKVLKFNSEEEVAVALAKYIADLSAKFIREKGSFSVVLSGGSLIDTMRKLVESPYKESIEWSKWLIFWLDERVVPLDDKDSNYLLAQEGFLSKVPIPASSIYAIKYQNCPESVANEYEARLKHLVATKVLPVSSCGGFPKFDLILLGMGPDGHVASLFPNRTQQFETKRWITYITDSPKPPPPRITFTFPVINAATENAMVVTGSDVANAVGIIFIYGKGPNTDNPLPGGRVSAEKVLTWFLDKDATSQL